MSVEQACGESVCPPHRGGQPGAKRQAGGQAGRNVSSRAQACRNMARARPPARAALALSPSVSRNFQNGKTWAKDCPPCKGGQREQSSRGGSSTSHVAGWPWGTTNISAGLTPRLALRAEAVPLCEGDNKTAHPKLHQQISTLSQISSRRSSPTVSSTHFGQVCSVRGTISACGKLPQNRYRIGK